MTQRCFQYPLPPTHVRIIATISEFNSEESHRGLFKPGIAWRRQVARSLAPSLSWDSWKHESSKSWKDINGRAWVRQSQCIWLLDPFKHVWLWPGNHLLHYCSTIAIHETMQETSPCDQNSFAHAVLSTRQSQQRCSFPTAPKTNLREPVSAVGKLQLPQQNLCSSQQMWEKTRRLQPEMAVQKDKHGVKASEPVRAALFSFRNCLPQMFIQHHTTTIHYPAAPVQVRRPSWKVWQTLYKIWRRKMV